MPSARQYILIIGDPRSGKLSLLKDLAGSLPIDLPALDKREPHVGISHTVEFNNKYFKATLPVWIDEFTDQTNGEVSSDSESKISTSKEWAEAFCSDEEEVQMVRDSIIAIIYAFDPKQVLDRDPQEQAKTFKNYLDTQVSNILKFVDKLDQDMWDGISIAVAKTSPTKHTQERTAVIDYARDMFLDSGIEVVDMLNTGMKDGERQGLERVREILETHVALSGTAEEDEEEFQGGEQQSDDPLVNAIQEMLGDGTEGHHPFDTKQLDKTLAESGFAFPLLDGKNAGSVDRTGESDIAVGDMEQLANKIRVARKSKESMPADEFKSLMNDIARDLSKFI